MATGTSISASQVEEPPLPGGRFPKEYVTACFTACGASVTSTTYSFQTSFTATPSVWGAGINNGSIDGSVGHVFAASMTANDVVLAAHTDDKANGSFDHKNTFIFSE